MSIIELKESIIERIKSIENFSVLDRVNLILQQNEDIYDNDILQSENEIKSGKLINHSEVLKRVESWKKI